MSRRKKIILSICIVIFALTSWFLFLYNVDGDKLSNWSELTSDTSMFAADTDDDGLNDGVEVHQYNSDPTKVDTDGDGLSDGAEVNTYQTKPLITDSDDDGLSDGGEVKTYGTEPLVADTDNDNLSDGLEVNTYGTDPKITDTDNDNLSDWAEIDGWSISVDNQPQHITSDPLSEDSDGDNFGDWEEYSVYHTNPNSADTDSDNLSDWEELKVFLTDPSIKLKIVTKEPSQMVLTSGDLSFTPVDTREDYLTLDEFLPGIAENARRWGLESGYSSMFIKKIPPEPHLIANATLRFPNIRGVKVVFDYFAKDLILRGGTLVEEPQIGNECSVYLEGEIEAYHLFFRESNVFTYIGASEDAFSIGDIMEYARIIETRIEA